MNTESRAELTLRGLILGVLITLVFTAANVYFGLKAGLTFATSIPAAVISMALLRALRGATIQENNIVQTVASAAGTLSSIIFVLPGMVMIGWWTGFPYLGLVRDLRPWRHARRHVLDSAAARAGDAVGPALPGRRRLRRSAQGGQRRAAAAGVEESRAGLSALLWGSVVSGTFSLITATRILASDVARNFRVGERGVSGFDFLLSFALFGVGHLIGLWVRPGDAGGRPDRLGMGRAAFLGAVGDGCEPALLRARRAGP